MDFSCRKEVSCSPVQFHGAFFLRHRYSGDAKEAKWSMNRRKYETIPRKLQTAVKRWWGGQVAGDGNSKIATILLATGRILFDVT